MNRLTVQREKEIRLEHSDSNIVAELLEEITALRLDVRQIELLNSKLLASKALERERCARIAEGWGYRYKVNSWNPWVRDLNQKLEVQQKSIAAKIREITP